ncbi:hypothetical protein [Paraurantiacibacter namhicola]|uniref:Uncharacterized protein n=1 Tax=Paraurantiacibacter namhicola TaxID=645517 RepID=A0A1C7DAX8_9SPHN|nr:hypothetical protein [Paraurantiacibacter namhicola]ANU08636.1 hypothetical protein A6F65_02353 [Paraurantiacibacter namhicola]
MSFASRTSPSQLIGVIIGLIVCGLIVRMVMAGGVEEFFNPTKQVENEIEAAMKSRPGDLAIIQAIETHFPEEYEAMLENMAEAAMGQQSGEAVADAGSSELARFMARHPNDFAAAPDEALSVVLQHEGTLLDGLLAQDPVLCSDYIMGRMQVDDPLPDSVLQLIGQSAASKVKAMAAGRADQQLRFKTTPADLAALGETMRVRGASELQVSMFLSDSGAAEALDDIQRCEGAIHLVKGIEQQTAGRRALLVATFLTPAR